MALSEQRGTLPTAAPSDVQVVSYDELPPPPPALSPKFVSRSLSQPIDELVQDDLAAQKLESLLSQSETTGSLKQPQTTARPAVSESTPPNERKQTASLSPPSLSPPSILDYPIVTAPAAGAAPPMTASLVDGVYHEIQEEEDFAQHQRRAHLEQQPPQEQQPRLFLANPRATVVDTADAADQFTAHPSLLESLAAVLDGPQTITVVEETVEETNQDDPVVEDDEEDSSEDDEPTVTGLEIDGAFHDGQSVASGITVPPALQTAGHVLRELGLGGDVRQQALLEECRQATVLNRDIDVRMQQLLRGETPVVDDFDRNSPLDGIPEETSSWDCMVLSQLPSFPLPSTPSAASLNEGARTLNESARTLNEGARRLVMQATTQYDALLRSASMTKMKPTAQEEEDSPQQQQQQQQQQPTQEEGRRPNLSAAMYQSQILVKKKEQEKAAEELQQSRQDSASNVLGSSRRNRSSVAETTSRQGPTTTTATATTSTNTRDDVDNNDDYDDDEMQDEVGFEVRHVERLVRKPKSPCLSSPLLLHRTLSLTKRKKSARSSGSSASSDVVNSSSSLLAGELIVTTPHHVYAKSEVGSSSSSPKKKTSAATTSMSSEQPSSTTDPLLSTTEERSTTTATTKKPAAPRSNSRLRDLFRRSGHRPKSQVAS